MPTLEAMDEAWKIIADALCAEAEEKCMDGRHLPQARQIVAALDRAGWKLKPPQPPGFYTEKRAWWRRHEIQFRAGGSTVVVGRRWHEFNAYKLRMRLEAIRKAGKK